MAKKTQLLYRILFSISTLVIIIFGLIILIQNRDPKIVVEKEFIPQEKIVVETQIVVQEKLYIEEPTDEELLKLLFGDEVVFDVNPYNDELEVIWSETGEIIDRMEVSHFDDYEINYTYIVEKIRITELTGIKYHVYFGTYPFKCSHANATTVGGAIISNRGEGWKIDFVNDHVGSAGTFCNIGDDYEVVFVGPNKPGIVFHNYYAQSGFMGYSDGIYFEWEGEIIPAIALPIQSDYRIFCSDMADIEPEKNHECEYNTMLYKFIKGDNPEIYDIKIYEAFVKYNTLDPETTFTGEKYRLVFNEETRAYDRVEDNGRY